MEQIDLGSFEKSAESLGVLGVVITRQGREIAKRLWDDECRRNIYSATKSFTSCAVGFAVQEGLVRLDEPLTEAFSRDLPEEVSDNLAAATVRDLLTMCLGQEHGSLMGPQRPLYEEDDWVKMSLRIPFTDRPGTRFVYNNVGPYLAGILVQRRAGCDLAAYLQPRLFDHIGIRRPTWEIDPMGRSFGAGGLFLTLGELHRFGLFYLNEGRWNGRQLLDPAWIRESTKKQVDNGSHGYGYLFWRGPENSYRADGKYCQWSIVFPDKEAVLSLTAECRDFKALETAVFEELYPQI